MTTTSAPDSALVMAVRAALAGAGDPVRAAGQQAYMKSSMPYRGLTSPSCAPCCGRCSPTRRWPRHRGQAWEAGRASPLGRRDLPRGALRRDRPDGAPRGPALAGPAALGLYRYLVETGPGGTTSTWWLPTGSGRSCCGTGQS